MMTTGHFGVPVQQAIVSFGLDSTLSQVTGLHGVVTNVGHQGIVLEITDDSKWDTNLEESTIKGGTWTTTDEGLVSDAHRTLHQWQDEWVFRDPHRWCFRLPECPVRRRIPGNSR